MQGWNDMFPISIIITTTFRRSQQLRTLANRTLIAVHRISRKGIRLIKSEEATLVALRQRYQAKPWVELKPTICAVVTLNEFVIWTFRYTFRIELRCLIKYHLNCSFADSGRDNTECKHFSLNIVNYCLMNSQYIPALKLFTTGTAKRKCFNLSEPSASRTNFKDSLLGPRTVGVIGSRVYRSCVVSREELRSKQWSTRYKINFNQAKSK